MINQGHIVSHGWSSIRSGIKSIGLKNKQRQTKEQINQPLKQQANSQPNLHSDTARDYLTEQLLLIIKDYYEK